MTQRGEATMRLTKTQMKLLRQYAHTTDGNFMQGLPGTTKLWRPLGLLDWRGDSYGCHFFSITPPAAPSSIVRRRIVGSESSHSHLEPCARCDGSGHGPSKPTGYGWWWDETELALAHAMNAAQAPDSWDGPGWDESGEVECPFCGGTGLIQVQDTATIEQEERF